MAEEKKENINLRDETNLYEIGFHIIPIIEKEEIGAEVQKIKDILQEEEAYMVGDESAPKPVNLAYGVTKKIGNEKQSFKKAYFGWIKFEVLPERIPALKSKVEEIPGILRFVIVKTVRSGKMITRKPSVRKESESKKEKDDKDDKKEKKTPEKDVDEAIDELVIE